ncbi:MAG: type II toxin-antitoxin system VapC family toxin [Opitutaceae bacterium]
MDLILDTCALLSLSGLAQKKLTRNTLKLIASSDSLYVSACSLFEVALKAKKEQLKVEPFNSAREFWDEAISRYECLVLPVEAEDFDAAVSLPEHLSDPFDRIIIAQANRTRSEVVSYDRKLAAHGITLHE